MIVYPTSVQVHLAVKVRVVAGVLKVDYLVSSQITKQDNQNPYRHPAVAMPYLLQRIHQGAGAGRTTNLQGEAPW